MAAVFENCKLAILAAEGGTANNSNDYGGLTRLGVSKRQYPNLNLRSLSEDQLYSILEKDYWNRYRLGEIENQTVANQCMLLFINMNPINAGKIIQAAVNGCGHDLKLDGVVGSVTIRTLNYIPPFWLSDRIRTEATRYYLRLTDEDKTQIPNLRSWIRRVLI